MVKITRNAAAAAGAVHFFTGRPCQQGHVCARYVSTGNCLECSRGYVNAGRARRVETRPGVVVLRSLTVPRKYLREIMAVIEGYMALAGLVQGPPPNIVEPPHSMSAADAARIRDAITAGRPPPNFESPDLWRDEV